MSFPCQLIKFRKFYNFFLIRLLVFHHRHLITPERSRSENTYSRAFRIVATDLPWSTLPLPHLTIKLFTSSGQGLFSSGLMGRTECVFKLWALEANRRLSITFKRWGDELDPTLSNCRKFYVGWLPHFMRSLAYRHCIFNLDRYPTGTSLLVRQRAECDTDVGKNSSCRGTHGIVLVGGQW